jgi:hypothetical protein
MKINSPLYLIHHPKALVCYILEHTATLWPDDLFLKIEFYMRMSYKLNLKNPKTFNEKLNWSKLSDRKSQYTRMADKYQVKEYVKKIIGEEYVVPCFGV